MRLIKAAVILWSTGGFRRQAMGWTI